MMTIAQFGGYGVSLKVRRMAEAICEAAFCDWEGADFGIKLSCIAAAEVAVKSLDQQGWDLTLLDAEDVPTTGGAEASS